MSRVRGENLYVFLEAADMYFREVGSHVGESFDVVSSMKSVVCITWDLRCLSFLCPLLLKHPRQSPLLPSPQPRSVSHNESFFFCRWIRVAAFPLVGKRSLVLQGSFLQASLHGATPDTEL